MENSKKKKNDAIEQFSFWQQYHTLIIVILALFVMYRFIVLLENQKPQENLDVIYPLLTLSSLTQQFIAFIIIPIFFLVIMRMLITNKLSGEYNSTARWANLVAFGLMLFIGIILSGQLMFMLIMSDSYKHQGRLNLDNQTYMLTSHFVLYDGLNYDTYIIFECNNRGVICAKISETSRVNDATDPAELAFDVEVQAINIIVNGEIVHTHPLEE